MVWHRGPTEKTDLTQGIWPRKGLKSTNSLNTKREISVKYIDMRASRLSREGNY